MLFIYLCISCSHFQTVRDFGDARAANLSAVYSELIQKYAPSFKNFDMQYYDFPLKQIEAMWKARGGQFWQLIEPCDGFHPNQQFNALLAEYYWQSFEKLGWIGKENPYNKEITALFGDQGGY
jgi:acyloxyacyl hydrolase